MLIIKFLNLKMGRYIKSRDKPLSKEKVYFTHDNGGKPYKVVFDGVKISVYVKSDDVSYNKEIFSITDFDGFFPGEDTNFSNDSDFREKSKGNSILVRLRELQKYIFIGMNIFSFETTEKILHYYSPIGNSDVPYPVAVGEKNVFFFNRKCCC